MANPLILAGSGAAAGVLVGGPVGAAIGAGVGLLLGLASGGETSTQRKTGGASAAPSSGPATGSEGLLTEDGQPAADVPSPTGTPPAVPRTEDEVIAEAANNNIDPKTVIVGADGSYQGQDIGSGIVLAMFEGDVTPAAADISDRAKQWLNPNRDCNDGGCLTRITYETCRDSGQSHEACREQTSRYSYEYNRYGGNGLTEEQASWFPLDADVDKETAYANRVASEGSDVRLCSYDWEAGFGGKCDGGIVACDSDRFCGEGGFCFHAPDGNTECRERQAGMPVCRNADKWGEFNVYPAGMSHADAMNRGICPFPGTYKTAAERKTAAARPTFAQETTSTATTQGGSSDGASPVSATDVLKNAGVSPLSTSLASKLIRSGAASAIGSAVQQSAAAVGAGGLQAKELSPIAAQQATTQGALASNTQSQLAKFIRPNFRGVSPIAAYMGRGR